MLYDWMYLNRVKCINKSTVIQLVDCSHFSFICSVILLFSEVKNLHLKCNVTESILANSLIYRNKPASYSNTFILFSPEVTVSY